MATVVAFHAHPDDEIILTGGTLAKLAHAGHRTVIVVACDGHMEQFDDDFAPRLRELHSSAEVLGVNRVEHLGYADSGHGPILYPDPPGRTRFVRAPVDEAADRLAAILTQERPEILLSYDRNGGYGHPDHILVHEVGALAAKRAGIPRVLNATIPRELFAGLTWSARLLGYDATAISTGFTARADITHRIDVSAFASQRMNALAQHRSVLRGGGRFAKIAHTLRHMPTPVQTRLLRWEWFAENGFQRPAPGPLDDIFTQPILVASPDISAGDSNSRQ
ncbi:PIG-L deacetylase family protein [Nocardia sp. NPDC058658]|uniref:PIG-L deacetylase family protein n=1 Tax=Nocardia sp. NPDC058658 TaxID=3346580 RepID=UPI003669B411